MKKILQSALVLGVVSLVGVGVAQAQGAGRASFHIGGGLVLPMGDFKTGAKTGWQGMGGVSFGLAGIPLDLRVDGTYGQNNFKGGGGKFTLFGGLAGAQYNIGGGASPVHPYLLAQVGMTNFKATATGFGSASSTKFTWAGGGGLAFGMGSLNAFVEAKYLSISASGGSANMIPIVVGIKFGGGM